MVNLRPIVYDDKKEISWNEFKFHIYDVERKMASNQNCEDPNLWDFSFEVLNEEGESEFIDFCYNMEYDVFDTDYRDDFTDERGEMLAAVIEWIQDGGLFYDNVITNGDRLFPDTLPSNLEMVEVEDKENSNGFSL